MTCWVTSGDAGISTAVTEQGRRGRLRAVSEGCANGPYTAELQPFKISICELDTCVAELVETKRAAIRPNRGFQLT